MAIIDILSDITIDKTWSFSGSTVKDTSYITHGYYTYPAKFIPQLASRLIQEHSKEGDIVIDTFMGSGTTVVEALINNRIGIGTDINEIAHLVAKVKTTPLNSLAILKEFQLLENDLLSRNNGQKAYFLDKALDAIPKNERIDYWFKQTQKENLAIILHRILAIQHTDIKDFFLVAFSQILKTASIWLQKSIKPTRDPHKKEADVLALFLQQAKKMLKRNAEFEKVLPKNIKENIDFWRVTACQDARLQPCETEKASLIVTSPPYVTSYEYADLHQLPLLWLGYLDELARFRKKFIGSAYKERDNIDLKSALADQIVNNLGKNKKGREVKHYFADMLEVFEEMKRVLQPKGKACIVIGNTQFQGVDILNAEVFKEQFENIGFITFDIIKREIPSKMLPSTRDSQTGQFTKTSDINLTLAYPTEYILIMQKL